MFGQMDGHGNDNTPLVKIWTRGKTFVWCESSKYEYVLQWKHIYWVSAGNIELKPKTFVLIPNETLFLPKLKYKYFLA